MIKTLHFSEFKNKDQLVEFLVSSKVRFCKKGQDFQAHFRLFNIPKKRSFSSDHSDENKNRSIHEIVSASVSRSSSESSTEEEEIKQPPPPTYAMKLKGKMFTAKSKAKKSLVKRMQNKYDKIRKSVAGTAFIFANKLSKKNDDFEIDLTKVKKRRRVALQNAAPSNLYQKIEKLTTKQIARQFKFINKKNKELYYRYLKNPNEFANLF